MDLFTAKPQTVRGLRLLALNVQSTPIDRARKLLDAIWDTQANVLVLSELSRGKGSKWLLDGLYQYHYNIFWEEPLVGDYACAVCIRQSIEHWAGRSTREFPSRIRLVHLKIDSLEIALVGVYVPALNSSNFGRRREYFIELWRLLKTLGVESNSMGGILLGGDINAISPTHSPRIDFFEREGYPFHKIVEKLELAEQLHSPADYTWYTPTIGPKQLLDNFFLSSSLTKRVTRVEVLHHFRENKLSDHSGILLEIK